MYDDVPFEQAYWTRYRQFKVFCFSSTLEKLLISYGLNVWGARYYPDPGAPIDHSWDDLRAFFWQRYAYVDWPLVKRLMGEMEFARINLHWTPEEHEAQRPPIGDEELANGKVQVSSWFKGSEEYRSYLTRYNVYFASRIYEGIGLSFLEAMAMGLCVVAPERPTMNEYIENGRAGSSMTPKGRFLSIFPARGKSGLLPGLPASWEEVNGSRPFPGCAVSWRSRCRGIIQGNIH